jgi:tripartite ATP-independent transporter DctP family solute receptor
VVAVLILCGCSQKNEEIVLKLGHALDRSHPVHKAMLYMSNRLAERSEGTIHLNVLADGTLGSEHELIHKVLAGELTMVKASAANLEKFDPVMGVFGLPYLFSDSQHYWRVLNGPIGKQLLFSPQEAGLVGLCFYDAGGRSFYTASKRIESPTDLVDLRIRVINSPTSIRMIECLGAKPAPLPFGELYSALHDGVVDGAENNPPSFFTSRHYEICPYYSLDEHTMIPDVLLIGAKAWQALPEEVRTMIKEAAEESSRYQRELWMEETKSKLESLSKQGVEIIRPDRNAFRKAALPMYEEYLGTPMGELISSIRGGAVN